MSPGEGSLPSKPKPVKPRTTERRVPRPVGRPSEYKPEFARQAEVVCKRCGAVNEDLAEVFGVSLATIKVWVTRHPEFQAAITAGKSHWDDRVELSLARKALGYNYSSEKLFMTKGGKVVRCETVEHVPPSDTAIIFFLKNRRPDVWKDRREDAFDPDKPLRVEVVGGLPTVAPPKAGDNT